MLDLDFLHHTSPEGIMPAGAESVHPCELAWECTEHCCKVLSWPVYARLKLIAAVRRQHARAGAGVCLHGLPQRRDGQVSGTSLGLPGFTGAACLPEGPGGERDPAVRSSLRSSSPLSAIHSPRDIC